MMFFVPPLFSVRNAAPADALPAGRIGYDPSADRLLLHTIQTEDAVEELLSTGQLRPHASFADPWLADAYQWMQAQMATSWSMTCSNRRPSSTANRPAALVPAHLR